MFSIRKTLPFPVLFALLSPTLAQEPKADKFEIKKVAEKSTNDGMAGLAFSGNGETIATITPAVFADFVKLQSGKIRIWDTKTGKMLAGFAGSDVGAPKMALNPNGTLLAMNGQQGLEIWDARRGRRLTRLQLSKGPRPVGQPVPTVMDFKFSPSGRTLVASYHDAPRVWDPRTARVRGILKTALVRERKFGMGEVHYAPKSDCLLIGESNLGNGGLRNIQKGVSIWSTKTGKAIATMHLDGMWVDRLEVSQNGTRAVGLDKVGKLLVWDLSKAIQSKEPKRMSLKPWKTIELSTDPKGFGGLFSIAPSGRAVAVEHMVMGKKYLTFVDPDSGKVLKQDELPMTSGGYIAFSPNGKLFARATTERLGLKNQGKLTVWSVTIPE